MRLTVLLAVAACGVSPGDLELVGLGRWDAGWQFRVTRATPLMAYEPDSGCLRATSQTLAADTFLATQAASAHWVMVSDGLACVARADTEETHPALPPAPGATVVLDTERWTFGADGCRTAEGPLTAGTRVEARGQWRDAQYRGVLVVDAELNVAPLRHVDVDDRPWPWHSGVQLIRPVTGGFVVGGGVVIGPRAILTAGHLGVDGTTCFSREARTPEAWDGNRFDCEAVERVVPFPGLTDAAVVVLEHDTPPPYAKLRRTRLVAGEDFYTSRWHTLLRAPLGDTTVESVGNENFGCQPWPTESTFLGADSILAGGDSGGPAYAGDELVGITHGMRCRHGLSEPMKDVYVHVPAMLDFLAPFVQ